MRIAPDHEAVALALMSRFWSGVFREQQWRKRQVARLCARQNIATVPLMVQSPWKTEPLPPSGTMERQSGQPKKAGGLDAS